MNHKKRECRLIDKNPFDFDENIEIEYEKKINLIDNLKPNKSIIQKGEYKASAYMFSAIFKNKQQNLVLGIICHSIIKDIINDLQSVVSLEVVSKEENKAILILKAEDHIVDVIDFLPMQTQVQNEKIKISQYFYMNFCQNEESEKEAIVDFNKHCEVMKQLLATESKTYNFDRLNSVETSIYAKVIMNENDFVVIHKNDIYNVRIVLSKKD